MEDEEKDSGRDLLKQALLCREERMRHIRLYRQYIAGKKEKIAQRHRAGGGGQEVAQRHACLVDHAIEEVYAAVLESLPDPHAAVDLGLSLAAVGGYGRGELNPCSDVDILFVHRQATPPVEKAIQDISCLLYDTGFEVGHHCCYSILEDRCLDDLDLMTKTAMVETRHLAGDRELFESFSQILRQEWFDREATTFIEEKIQERAERYALYQSSTHLLEPNIKEGPGGLRDYHTAIWLVKAGFRLESPEDLWEAGILPHFWRSQVLQAYDFLLRVRSELHYACGKRSDVLRIYLQGRVADGLGYRDGDRLSAAAAFMKDYYRCARILSDFSHRVAHHCQTEKRGRGTVHEKELGDGYFAVNGEIRIRKGGGDPAQEDPLWLMRLFCLVQEGLFLSEELKQTIRSHLSEIDEAYRRNPEVSRLFLSILKGKRSAAALRQMHEVGVLGRYLPEFEGITGLIQYDIYHQYTVDEHSLRGIEHLEELPHSEQKELKELIALYQGLSNPEIVKLALLLHDVGKGEGGCPLEEGPSLAQHIEKGAQLARQALDRMGLSGKIQEKVELLVRHHILMSHTAQRRDMHDKEAIRQFAEAMKNVDNLQRLYLLTYGDIQAVGQGVWTVWKGALLWELYHKSYGELSRDPQEELTGEARVARIKEEVQEELLDEVEAEILEDYFQAMPYKYILSTTAEKIAAHIRLIWKLGISHGKLALSYSHNGKVGYSELMVCTADKPGIFSQIAGTLTSKNINILGAQIFTRKDRIAIDTLQVASVEGKPLMESGLLEEIEEDLLEIIQGKKRAEDLVGRRRWVRRPSSAVATRIEIDNKISDTHTVIEIFTQDRLGLLYDITCVLHRLGIDIYLAKISTEANRAIDVFYVTDLEGEKILAEDKVGQIRKELSEVLADPHE